MKTTILTFASLFLLASVSFAATPAELTKPVCQFIDGFNTGELKSVYAAFAAGEVTIVDEFAPFRWTGANAAHDWVAGYDKHATATGVTDGHVTCGKPTRTETDGTLAYVILPSTYTYKEHGKPLQEEAQITATLRKEASGWKMQGWTWTGVKPHPAK